MPGIGVLDLDFILAHGLAYGSDVFGALGANYDLLAELETLAARLRPL